MQNDDLNYTTILGSPASRAIDSLYHPTAELAKSVNQLIGNYARCLTSLSQSGQDDAFIDDRIKKIADLFHAILRAEQVIDVEWAAKQISIAEADLVTYLKRTYPSVRPRSVSEGCTDLMISSCTGPLNTPEVSAINDCPIRQVQRQQELAAHISKLLQDPVMFQGPYAAMLYSNILWELDQYRAAANELDLWVRQKNARDKTYDWYRIRAENMLGIIIEEWVRKSPILPIGLIEYHLGNLDTMIKQLEDLPGFKELKLGFPQLSYDIETVNFIQRPSWTQPCSLSK